MVGTVRRPGPPQPARDIPDRVAVAPHQRHIFAANRFDTANQSSAFPLKSFEPHPAREWQRFFRRVDYLQQMPSNS